MSAREPTYDELAGRAAALESALEDCRAELLDCGKRAEQLEASRKTDEELIRFLDAVTDGFILVDSDLRIIRASEGSSRSVGQRPQDVVGKKLDEVYVETRPSGRCDKYLEVLRTGKPFECDAVFPGERGEKHISLIAVKAGDSLGIATIDITERKNVEQALHEARKDWEAVFQAAGNPAFVLDPELRLISANQAATQALGMSADELRGKRCYELMHNSSAPPENCPGRQILDGAPAPIEAEMDALGRTFLVCCAPVRDDRGNVTKLIHVATDITERKQMEQTLRESQAEERAFSEQLAALHEVALELSEAKAFDDLCRRAVELGRDKLGFERLGLWFLTGDGLEVRGSFGVDEAGAICDERDTEGPVAPDSLMGQVLGGELRLARAQDIELRNARGDVVGRGEHLISSLWDGHKVIGCLCADNLLGGQPLHGNRGELLNLFARTLGHLCSRQRGEEALRESETKHRTLLENLPQKIFSKDRDSVYLSGNATFARDLNIKPEEFQGKTDFDFFPEELAEKYRADDREVIESGRTRDIEESYIQDGEEVVVHTVKTPLRDAEGNILGVLGIFWDITEQKRAEEEVRQLTRNLERRVAERTADLVATNLELADEITERHEAQEALRDSEQRYRTLTESARESIFIIDGNMTLRYVNSFGARQLRRAPEAAVGLTVDELFAGDTSAELKKQLGAVFATGQPASVEQLVVFAHAPDRQAWLETQLTPLRDQAGRVEAVMGVSRDTTRRRRAEEAVRESEERYHRVVEDQTELICRFRPTGELTFVNGAYCRYFDKEPENLIGRAFLPLIPEEDRSKPGECIAALTRDKPVGQVEHRVIDPDGGPLRWVRWINRLILDEQGNTLEYQAVGRDITREKHTEQALRRTQRERAAILNSMTEHVVYHDTNMTIVWANRTACDSVGLAPEEIVGKTCYELWQGRSSLCDGCPVKRTLETGGPHEEEMATPDGRHWFVRSSPVRDENGDLVGVVEITTDITERKRAREALRESEQRFQQVAEQAQEWIWEVDADGAYTYASPVVERILGYQPAELVGKKHFYDLFHPEDREKRRKEALGVFARKESFREFVNRNVRKDGETVWLSTSGVPTLDAQGDLVGYRGADTDITEQRQAQEALRESEARYRALFEQAADSIVLVDPDTGALVEFNDRAHENLGYSREEFDKLNLADIEVAESPEEVAAHIEAVAEQGSDTFETKQRRKNGDIRDVHVSTRVISARGKKFVHAVWRDITEQRQAQEALRESEERYRTIYEAIPDAVFLYDPATTKLTSANGVMLELYGYTADQIEADEVSVFDLPPESDQDRVRDELAAAIDRPGPQRRGARRAVKRDGTPLWVDTTTAPIEFAGRRLRMVILRDVTESVRAREQVDRQAMLLANVTDAVAVVTRDRKVTYWNRGAEALFGYTEEDMAGSWGFQIVLRNPDEASELDRQIQRGIDEDGVWSHNRLPCRHKNGKDIWVNAKMTALDPGPEGTEGALLVARDVTDEVLLQQRLILTERMAAIGTLALSVSHELNNMLGGLRGLAELTADDPSLARRLVGACRAVAERGGIIAGRMTSIAKADSSGEERKIDVTSVVRTVVGMMGPSLAPRDVTVEEDYGAAPPTWMNEGKLLQVLINLVSNARDSITHGGQIHVAVRHDPGPNHIVISVKDSGAGIDAEDMPRLFDPFFTTRREAGPDGGDPTHLGLGLPESLSIIREYGGTIDVDSKPGQGATFTVRLPVRSVPSTPELLRVRPAEMPPAGTRMLIVDDDELMRFWLTEHLTGEGYDVVTVADGREATEACRGAPFAYIFLDMLMPGEIDGAVAFRALKEAQPDARIIISSAFVEEDIPRDCLEAAFAVLKKPFGKDDLASAFGGRSTPG